jgi:PAS domain S-box-containing protein
MPTRGQGAQDALLDSEAQYRSLFEEAPVAYHEIDVEGVVQRVNRAECEMLGFEASEMVGRHIWEFVAPEGQERSRQAIREKVTGVRPLEVFEREYVRRDGSLLVLEIHENLIRDREGRVIGIRSALLDVTARRQAQQQLGHYAEELERKNDVLALTLAAAQEATEVKCRFLANVSHEIRTPMNGVLGMIDLLLATGLDRDQRRCAEVLRSSAESLAAVINDLLDFAKLEAGKLELEAIPFDPAPVLEGVASVLAPRAQEKGLELTCLVEPGLPRRLRGDPTRLRQVVTNLLSNAVKFTERGEVALRAELVQQVNDRAVVRVSVRDTGIGISPEFRARLFQSFVQADSSSTRRHSGTGLGLAICKQLVERMGGQIEVESELGRGTLFSCTIPFSVLPGVGRTEEPEFSLRGRRVLVVDDNATNRMILCRYLESWGCLAQEAVSAFEALEALREAARRREPFDGALVDMQMPDADGSTAGRWIKQDPLIRNTILVSLTSAPLPGDAARLREAGYEEFLHKPVRQSHLYDALIALLHPVSPPPAPKQRATRRPGKGRILLAEDNEVNRTIALRLIERAGYRADAVVNGRQAVDAVCEGAYDLVLMDIQMPEMDGIEATAEIHRRLGTPDSPPIIALTANAAESDRDRCFVVGMNDYLAKPIRRDELLEALRRWIGPPDGLQLAPAAQPEQGLGRP